MNHQTFDVRYIGQQRENLQIVNKPEGILPSALDLECKNGSAAVRKILFVQRVIRMFRQRRMIDFFHLGMGSQVFHHFLCVCLLYTSAAEIVDTEIICA